MQFYPTVDIVLDDLVATRQLGVGLRPRVRDILLKKHRHLYERRKSTQKKKTGLSSLRGTRKSSAASSIMDKGKSTGSKDVIIPRVVLRLLPCFN